MKTTKARKKEKHTLIPSLHTHTSNAFPFLVSIVNLKIYDYLIIYLRILNFLRFRLKFIFLFPKAFILTPPSTLLSSHPLFSLLLLLLLLFFLLFCLRQINSIDDTYKKKYISSACCDGVRESMEIECRWK